MDDKLVRDDVLEELDFDPSIDATNIGVAVDEGVVTLRGEVNWQYQKKAAEDAIRKLFGITGVGNCISIKPQTIHSSDIKKKIEDALARHAHLEAEAIRVDVQDGNKVSLEGKVDSWEEREAAERAAWSVAGVQSVDDRLTIAR